MSNNAIYPQFQQREYGLPCFLPLWAHALQPPMTDNGDDYGYDPQLRRWSTWMMS
jgi:hypothetical protein